MRETYTILFEATKVLRAEHTDFKKRLSLRFPAQTRVEYTTLVFITGWLQS